MNKVDWKKVIEDDDDETPQLPPPEAKKDDTPQKEFLIRPDPQNRFKSSLAKEIISNVLHDNLNGKKYSDHNPAELTKHLANTIRVNLEGQIYGRYKLIVHVILGEHKGAGLKSGVRCLWDPECDTFVSDKFINESMFCVATVYGVLFY
ncbi:hypothetical protein O3M35_008790 [Rhynocoris fuscipes]|uniref:Dynein light chain n=1 Tax=Rhynocoris fuscipes TaxID=488301 RepID=A0AAW1D9W0_9HEMI